MTLRQNDSRPPVTVLCGFLGAGKTTVLRHLLAHAGGRRWAAVVNDVAAVNIDGAIVRSADGRTELLEIGNGCVCCSSRDELAESVARLASTGLPGGPAGEPYDHILIETTGVAEPRPIASLFVRKNPFGRSLGDFARLANLVSVVSVPEFLAAWGGGEKRRATVTDERRDIVALMIEQLEVADVVLLNQGDRAGEADVARAGQVVRGLNPRAELRATVRGEVDADWLLGSMRFDAGATLGAARWIGELNSVAPVAAVAGGRHALVQAPPAPARPRHETAYGIGSFVYQARRPFRLERLRELVQGGLPGVIRAKGFFWAVEQPDEMGLVSIAGGHVQLDFLSYWWAALIANGRARLEDRPSMIKALWVEPGGDRRQEIAVIGVDLDEPALRAAFDACLVAG